MAYIDTITTKKQEHMLYFMSTLEKSSSSSVYLGLHFRVQIYLHFMATLSTAGAALPNIIRHIRAKSDMDLFFSMPLCYCGTLRD